MKQPRLDVDFGWCVFKYMFILLIFTNLLWAGIFAHYVYKSFNGTTMSADMTLESGTQNNNQSITNGKSNN